MDGNKQVLKVEYVNPKLSNVETKILLKKISADNMEYSLVFRLCYIYGRLISEVYQLKVEDIDFKENRITFNINNECVEYSLHYSLIVDLKRQCDNSSDYLFQHIAETIDNFSSKLNYQLKKYDYLFDVHVNPSDFKKLRGQHLILDGVGIKAISKLFHMSDNSATIRLLLNYEYVLDLDNGLSVDGILSDFTFV